MMAAVIASSLCGISAMAIGLCLIFRRHLEYRFKKLDFVKVCHDGSWVVVEPGDEKNFMDDESEYSLERVRMTRKQFHALPEFDGF